MENGPKYSAPYLPFKTFLTGLDHLAAITIPTRIELGTFYDMSGHNRTQMLSALKFFKLVDKEGHPQPGLSELSHNKDDRQQLIRQLLERFYPDIIALDLSKTTPSLLDKALDGSAYNVTGETKKKAKTFLLNAAQFAGFKPHTLLTKITRNRKKGGDRKQATGVVKAEANGNAIPPAETAAPPAPDPARGSEKTIQLRRGGSLSLSLSVNLWELKGDDRKFVFGLIDEIDAYESASNSSAEEVNKAEGEAGE